MKLYSGGFIVISIIVVALAAGYASSRWLGDDNPVEEAAESVIEEQTGLDIDLTPNTSERG